MLFTRHLCLGSSDISVIHLLRDTYSVKCPQNLSTPGGTTVTTIRHLIPILLLFLLSMSATASDNWRVRVNEQVKLSSAAMRADTVDVLTISIMLKKDGEEKDRDSTRTRRYYDGDERVTEQFNSDGEFVEKERELRPVGRISQSGLFSMFHLENAEIFTLNEQGYDDDGRLTIEFSPINPADSLFAGTAYIDTSVWFPVRLEMTMSELPDKVKEMAMVAIFEPDGDGVFRPASVIGDGRARFLLMNFYFRTETQFTW
jgi:YD repeat-containing protein